MFIIRKEFHFSASHQLQGLPEEHPCSRLHGHNYVITAELRSDTLNNVGFVRDYRALEPIKKWIDNTLDHQHLNKVFYDPNTDEEMNPTAENMAEFFYYLFIKWVPELYAIEVSETPKTTARYEQSPIKTTNEKS